MLSHRPLWHITFDRNFAFLEQISTEFFKRHRARRIATCNAYALNNAFQPTVRSAVHYHNVNHQDLAREERVQRILAKVQDMQQVLGRSIDLLLERGENIERLQGKMDVLEQDASIFKKKSAIIRARTLRKYYFRNAFYAFVALALLYVFMASVCGAAFENCRREDQGAN